MLDFWKSHYLIYKVKLGQETIVSTYPAIEYIFYSFYN